MRRVIVVAACALSLGACTSSDIFKFNTRPEPVSLQIQSMPSGALAKLPNGQGCTTPCRLPVVGPGEVPIAFTLDGYLPTTTTVQLFRPADPTAATRAVPNPVVVALEKAPPKKKRRHIRHHRVRRPAPKHAAPKHAAPKPKPKPKPTAAAPAPGPATSAAPPAPANTPWPTPPAQQPAQPQH